MRGPGAGNLPPAPLLISSPYDSDAHYSKKREAERTGYKVHITETCDDDTPYLITNVTIIPATTSDFAVLPTIQANLAARQMTPGQQIVDAGYVTADHLLTSQTKHGIEHAIGDVKRFWMVKDKVRLSNDGIRDALIETCCGLHKFRLQYRPCKYVT